MEWYFYVIIILVILLGVSIFGIVNLVKKLEKLTEAFDEQVLYLKKLSYIIKDSRENINKLDEKGAFESDDEVGRFFEAVKKVQGILDNFILPEEYGKKEKE